MIIFAIDGEVQRACWCSKARVGFMEGVFMEDKLRCVVPALGPGSTPHWDFSRHIHYNLSHTATLEPCMAWEALSRRMLWTHKRWTNCRS
ncbi:uncharacterized protein LOC116474997 isoform X2 [Hylobates moloch]|nr:uncharacterized protein LOC116474997 isoform X2 [Hylobates moloch]